MGVGKDLRVNVIVYLQTTIRNLLSVKIDRSCLFILMNMQIAQHTAMSRMIMFTTENTLQTHFQRSNLPQVRVVVARDDTALGNIAHDAIQTDPRVYLQISNDDM